MKLRLVVALFAVCAAAAGEQKIPAPAGPYGIGRVGYHWVDASRGGRELMVYFWYPAARTVGAKAEYLPGARQMDTDPESGARLRRAYATNWPNILSGQIHADATERGAIAKSPRRFPLVIFSHGLGSTGFEYTALIEDVVSHGYVVAAIEHPGVARAVWIPNGRVIPRDDASPSKAMSSQITDMVEQGARDVRFVLDRVLELDRDPRQFSMAGRLDGKRVAAMGHSAGAEFAARACQLDERFRVCIDLDGAMVPVAALPIAPDGAKIRQPLLYLEAYHPESQMGGSPAQIAEFFKIKETQLLDCPRGTYDVVLRSPGIAHPSFSDTPLLFAGEGGYPERTVVLHNLELIGRFVREFLGKNFRGEKAPAIDSQAVNEATVTAYPR